jgi:hypothetical protein
MIVSHLQIDTPDRQFEIKQKGKDNPSTITMLN